MVEDVFLFGYGKTILTALGSVNTVGTRINTIGTKASNGLKTKIG